MSMSPEHKAVNLPFNDTDLDDVSVLSEALFLCHSGSATFLPTLPNLSGALTIGRAYEVQRRLIDMLEQPIVGWKLAATTKSVQQQNGLSEPIVGALLGDAILKSPAKLSFSKFNKPKAEPEIALILADDISPDMGLKDSSDALAFVAQAHIAFELADTRYLDDSGQNQVVNVADNCAAGYLVLGDEVDLDVLNLGSDLLRDVPVSLNMSDGQVIQGFDAVNRPDPIASLIFLAEFASRYGITLERGSVITTGTFAVPTLMKVGTTVANFGVLGSVELALANEIIE